MQEIVNQGIANYREKALKLRNHVIEKLVELKFKPVIDPSIASNSVVAFYVPPGIDAYRLKVHLMEQDKIAIETGLSVHKATMIRIGFMSNLTIREANQLIAAIADYVALH